MFTIATPSDLHDTLFYVKRNEWTPEYPDAYTFNSREQAEKFLANIRRMNPDNERYQNATVR